MGRKEISRTHNYDTPDGQDCAKKALHSAKVAGALAFSYSIIDIVGSSHTKGLAANTGRVIHFVGPAASIAAIYGAGSCLAGDIRGKDGPLNHAIGGALAGTTFGIHKGSWKIALGFSLGFAFLGSITKLAAMKDFKIIPDPSTVHKQYGGLHEMGHFGPRREVKLPKDY